MSTHDTKLFNRRATLDRATRHSARALSGAMTEAEAKQLRQWPKLDSEYATEFVGTLRMMAEIEPLADDPDIQDLLIEAGKQRRVRWPAFAAAAGFLLAVSAVIWLSLAPQDNSNVLKYTTRIGEQKTVTLTDGSVITLNTGTQLLVDFSRDDRRVLLERGEGYFDIAADPARPFSVSLGEHAVTVLGTQFNLLKSPEKFMLVVVEGEVAVHRSESGPDVAVQNKKLDETQVTRLGISGKKIHAGTVAEYNYQSGKFRTWEPTRLENLSGWRSGILSFEKAHLSEVVEELNRYTRKKILIRDAELMDVDVYAIIRLDQIAQALEGLEISLPIKIIAFHDRYIIVVDENKNN